MKCFRNDGSTIRKVRSDDKTVFLGVFGLASDFYKRGIIENFSAEDEWLYIDTDARYMSSYEMDRLRILSRYILHRYPIPSYPSIDEIKYCVNDMIITKKLLNNIWGYYDDSI